MPTDGSNFPSGLRVLLVDSDVRCLENLRSELQEGCNYEVTCCTGANDALSLLLEKKDGFDIVLTSYNMPGMDGIQLLESIRSMEAATCDLPVVLFSGESDRDVVIRAVEKGACDFLLKPIPDQNLRMIWHHVVRLKLGKERTVDNRISEVNHPQRYGPVIRSSCDDAIASQSKGYSKRKRNVSCDEEIVNNAGTAAEPKVKKFRLKWTKGLQEKFLDALDIIDRRKNPYKRFRINGQTPEDEHAIPREIVEEMHKMGVTGLTREQVSSHLQKYRINKNKRAESMARRNTQSDQSYPTPGQCYAVPIGPMFLASAADCQHLFPESCEVSFGAQEYSNYFSGIVQQVGPLPVSGMSNQPMMVSAPHDSVNQQKPPEPPDAINHTAPNITQSPGNLKDGIPEPVPETVKAGQPNFPSQPYPSEHPNTDGFDSSAAATADYTSFDMGNLVEPTDLYEDLEPLGLQGLDVGWLDCFVDSSGSVIL